MTCSYKTDGLCTMKEKFCNSFVGSLLTRNPLIAGMIVTIIVMIIAYWNSNATKVFILASLINMVYLLFHAHCVKNDMIKKYNTGEAAATGFDGFRSLADDEISPEPSAPPPLTPRPFRPSYE